MPKVDLDGFTIGELETLIADSKTKIVEKREGEKRELLEQMQKLAEQRGLTLEDVIGTQRGRAGRSRKPLAAKYQNPKNKAETWSGRGRKPRWASDHLEAGGNLEELEI